ncbi:hypothetical protein [Chromobacterium haemolyticum]|uniref:hypothetical protein n=1 Tax=Chromobacterium haemolyticum TaxID=394935 RepID=UPI001132935A|nr:hypothetical protein [Chromobacterium haemolyticum]
MKISDIRRQNLIRLIEERFDNNQTVFAGKTGKKQSQISDMVRGTKSFGEKIARDLEHRLSLPPFWLDSIDHKEGTSKLNTESRQIIPQVHTADLPTNRENNSLDLEEIARQVQASGQEHVLKLIKLLAENSSLKK